MRKIAFVFVLVLFAPLLIAQQAMNNDSVIKLCKAGLSDDLIISTITASPGAYDTSPDAITALKNGGASDKVLSAIMTKLSAPPAPSVGAEPKPSPAPPTASSTFVSPSGIPRIFVKADQNFSVALAAALNKKHAPATIVLDEKFADYVLQSASVSAKQESGASKIARCLFAYCIGIEGTSSVSVQLIRTNDGAVVWAYQVRKANGGPVGIQSLSEAVAKHLKNEFLKGKQ